MSNERDIAMLRRDLDRLQARVPLRQPATTDQATYNPYITLLIQGGNTLLAGGPVYGIKRVAGEALFDPTDKPGNVQATATCTISSGSVNTVTQVIKGEGYTAPPVVSVGAPPGGGTQAVITATVAPSFVKFVYITNCGSLYDGPVTVTFSAPGGGGTTATGSAVIRDGKVVGVTITNPGSGYAAAPSVTLTPTVGGAGAAATSVLAIGSITLAVTTAGSGYLTAPVVYIPEPTDIPSSEAYADGIGIAQVMSGPLYTPSLPAPAVGSQVIVVHDDRSLVAYGLMGDGPAVPFSRPPDGVATWYQTLVKILGADADADGVLPAWVPMFGGV